MKSDRLLRTAACVASIATSMAFVQPTWAATLSLTAGDASGTSSFTNPLTGAAAGWGTPGQAPTAGNDYTAGFLLRTPATGDHTFPGDSLTIQSGGGQLGIKGPVDSTVTVNGLVVDGGVIWASSVLTTTPVYNLAGSMTVNTTAFLRAFNNGTSNHILNLAAAISGAGTLNIYNDNSTNDSRGTIRLSAANPFTGTVSITSNPRNVSLGALQLNNFDALQNAALVPEDTSSTQPSVTFAGGAGTYNVGSLAGTVATGNIALATGIDLSVGASNTSTSFAGFLAGNGTLTKVGSGTLTLTGPNNIDGGIAVTAGTLLINGDSSSSNGNATVSGGVLALGASGNISGVPLVEVNPSGVVDTTAQSFSMLAGQTFRFILDGTGSGTAGRLDAGSLDIDAGVVDFSTTASLDDPAYVIASYTALTGSTNTFSSITNLPAGYVIDYGYNGGTQIAAVAVPEPGVALLGLAAAAGGLYVRRRKKPMAG